MEQVSLDARTFGVDGLWRAMSEILENVWLVIDAIQHLRVIRSQLAQYEPFSFQHARGSCLTSTESCSSWRWGPVRSRFGEVKLEAFMALAEAQPLIKPMGIQAVLVRGELDDAAAARAGLINGPAHHFPAQAALAIAWRDVHSLDQAAPHPAAIEAGNEAQLQRSHGLALEFRDDQTIPAGACDGIEGGAVLGRH